MTSGSRDGGLGGDGAKRLGQKMLEEVEVEDLSSVCVMSTKKTKHLLYDTIRYLHPHRSSNLFANSN
jgi:hypothetical protein